MKWDPKWPRNEPDVIEPETARLLGMTEAERLAFAAGEYFTMDQLVRIIEAEYGTGEEEPPRSGDGTPT